MQYHTRRVEVDELIVDIAALARALGYQPPGEPARGPQPAADYGRPMPDHLIELAERALVEGRSMLEPQWTWVIVPVTLARDALICRSAPATELAIGGIVRSQLRGSEAAAVFVATIGSGLEQYARRLLADPARSLEGYVLDTVGSIAVEAAGDRLEGEVAERVTAQGWKITNRFSPGYCTWETADQQALFSLFPDRPAGVVLNASSLMSPIKSISGVIGLGPQVEHRPYACDICTMTTCRQRLVSARPISP